MPFIFLLGSLLWTVVWWFIAWSHIPLLTEYSFFPLWVGYILVLNAVCEVLFKTSLIRKLGWLFVWLFVISVPMWWGFEYLNTIVQNWHYLYRPITTLHFFLQSSIDFSTVVPVVLSTGYLFYRLLKDIPIKPLPVRRSWLVGSMLLGVVPLCFMPFFPNELFPFVWIAPLLILDPINYALGLPSVFGYVQKGQWRVPLATALGTLFAGFWWEMWNFWSYPKWFYTIPYVGFWKVFEMPILGYGGYLLFGLMVLVYTALVTRVLLAKHGLDKTDAFFT